MEDKKDTGAGLLKEPQDFKPIKVKGSDYKQKVTRGELIEILGQITNNMNELSNYVMSDMNNLFKNFTYPTLMKLGALVELLIDNGTISREELDKKITDMTVEAIKKAREVPAEEPKTEVKTGESKAE
jgi:hypothetical protein